MRILHPNTPAQALDWLAEEAHCQPIPIAGGTDLLVRWHQQDKSEATYIDLSGLRKSWGGIELTRDSLHLGALTTYWDVITHPGLREDFGLLAAAAREVGAIQIQTRGTWAGNIANASPAADGVPVLMAYGARVILASVRGHREVPLDEFYKGYKKTRREPDELIAGIMMPRRLRMHEWWHKVGTRAAQSISKVGVAAVHDGKGWRVAVNSVAPVVMRCRALEKALGADEKFDNPEQVQALLDQEIAPIDDIRSNERYRRRVLARLIFNHFTPEAVLR